VTRSLDRIHVPAIRRLVDRRRVEFLRRYIPPRSVGAEVGVHKGHFSDVILDVVQPTTLHLIDPWYLLGTEWSWGKGDRSTGRALGRIISRMSPRLADGQVVVHVGWALDVMDAFEDASLDWIYVDTSHRYEDTKAQLPVLARKVRPGGVIAGDDWYTKPSHPHHGVARAVQEFAADENHRLVYSSDGDHQWAISRPAS
jgi:hypothetical protein